MGMIVHVIKSIFPTFYSFAQNIFRYSWRGNREGGLTRRKYIPWLIVSLLLSALLLIVFTVFRYEYIGSERIGGVYKIDRITGRVYVIQYDTMWEVKETPSSFTALRTALTNSAERINEAAIYPTSASSPIAMDA